jgi:hypothetical protein
MPHSIKSTGKAWFAEKAGFFRQGKCSHINCRSRLEKRNPLRDEIQAIIDSRFGNNRCRPKVEE